MSRRNTTAVLIAVLIHCGFAAACFADDAVPAEPPLRWWKGNIHTHSLWSDGNDFPEMIAEWYRTHGYNFLALSDHNILSEGVRWMKHDDIVRRGAEDALEKYEARFGGGWVETRGEPGTPEFAVRLKPLDEFRPL
ncbi:MAG: histidinol-phosphatase, partial [Planctomycetes bacterium]|nr:histidinol-phosphatase [Planctomycetota bacterium]